MNRLLKPRQGVLPNLSFDIQPQTSKMYEKREIVMPLYKGPAGYGRIMNFVMNLLITICFVIMNLWIAQSYEPNAPIFTPINFMLNLVTGFGVAYTVGDTLPLVNLGNKAAAHFKNRVASTLVSTAVMAFLFATILSLVLGWVNNFLRLGAIGTFFAWLSGYPLTLLVAFVVVLAAVPVGSAIARSISGFDPRQMHDAPEFTGERSQAAH